MLVNKRFDATQVPAVSLYYYEFTVWVAVFDVNLPFTNRFDSWENIVFD